MRRQVSEPLPVDLTDRERAVLDELAAGAELTPGATLRRALQVYQLVQHWQRAGGPCPICQPAPGPGCGGDD